MKILLIIRGEDAELLGENKLFFIGCSLRDISEISAVLHRRKYRSADLQQELRRLSSRKRIRIIPRSHADAGQREETEHDGEDGSLH